MNEYIVSVNNRKLNISLREDSKAIIDGKDYFYHLSKLNDNTFILELESKSFLITLQKKGDADFIVYLNGSAIETRVLTSLQEKAAKLVEIKSAKHALTFVKSPMPGMILRIKKNPGDEILQGESVIILEAMKMENDIRSQISGRIKEIKVKEGTAVEKDVILFTIE